MASPHLFIPDTPASPIETELEREMRLAEEFDAAQAADRGRVLEEFIAAQDAAKEEAIAAVRKRERVGVEKGRMREVEGSDLTPQRYGREMRSNGTAAQQEEWRSFGHEVRGWYPFLISSDAWLQSCVGCTERGLACTASAAIKCAPCEQTHRPCSWVAAYRRWRIQQVWPVDDAELDRLELAATVLVTADSASPRKPAPSPEKTIKRPPLPSEREVGSSRTAAATAREDPGKRKRVERDERLVVKIPRAARVSEVTASVPRSRDHENLVEALAASQEEASRLRRQLEAQEREKEECRERAREWEERARSLSERWDMAEQRVDRLQAQAAEVHEEMAGLRHALSVANEQGSREELELRIAQLERRVEREYSPRRRSCATPLTPHRSRPEFGGDAGLARARVAAISHDRRAVGRPAPRPLRRRGDDEGLGGGKGRGSSPAGVFAGD